MKSIRGVEKFTKDEWDILFSDKRELLLDDHHRHFTVKSRFESILTDLIPSYHPFSHSLNLVIQSLIDYFSINKDLLKDGIEEAFNEEYCGWYSRDIYTALEDAGITIEEYGLDKFRCSDFCYELINFYNGFLNLQLSDEQYVQINEVQFFALSLMRYADQVNQREFFWETTREAMIKKWQNLPENAKKLCKRHQINDAIWNDSEIFSVINELFIYFQKALINSSNKSAISEEKSRIAKIKAKKKAEQREPQLKKLQELWDTEDWTKKGRGKYTQFAKYITYNDMIENMEFDAIRTYISNYDKGKC